MRRINYSFLMLLGVLFQAQLFAAPKNNTAIDMAELELFYKQQQQQGNQDQQAQETTQPVYQSKQEDLRARRLREWQAAQHQAQPVSMQPNHHAQNTAPTPEADDLFAAAINGDTNRVASMVSQGIDINTSNRERETALHMAAARGHYSMVIYLINNGAYTGAKTIKNWVPLHHAVRFRHHNIANFLVKHGSSPHEKTSDGKSAIDMAQSVNDYRLLSILGSR